MRKFKFAAALLAALVLSACGGGASDQPTKVKFSSLVSFGDSLSDVGTYSVGTVKALGGGKYTVNAPDAKNWVELMAAQLSLSAPCPAQTGLDGDAAQGFFAAVTNVAACTAYAQGGARVTNPVGPGNKLLGGSNAILGQLTDPVVNQIGRHLAANGGVFKGDEIVFVLAGGNDVFINLGALSTGATSAAAAAGATAAAEPGATPASIEAAAQTAAANYFQTNSPAAVQAMGVAGAELGGYVKNLIVGKGAKYVTVVNLPDVSQTPFARSFDATTQGLINLMVTTFNTQLQSAIANDPNVLLVDAYTEGRTQHANPVQYGIANLTTPACDLSAAKNPLGSSLVCTKTNLIAGATDTFQYADTVHPTPFGYRLLATVVASEMVKKGWL